MAAVFRRVKLNNEFDSAVKFSLTKRGYEQFKYESTCCRLPHQLNLNLVIIARDFCILIPRKRYG